MTMRQENDTAGDMNVTDNSSKTQGVGNSSGAQGADNSSSARGTDIRTALFTGSFNPFTLGHADIAERALKVFDRLVIGIGYNPEKNAGDVTERLQEIQQLYKDDPRVVVEAYSDLTADLAARHGAHTVVKGVRSVQDFEYERQQAEFNGLLGEELDTMVFFAKPELTSLSSSMLRQLQHFGRDISSFLPKAT